MPALDDLIQQLQQQAGPRGSTFAGRRVGSDPTTAANVISKPAQEATDEGFSLNPELMAELAKMSPLMALGVQSAKKGAAQELGPLEKLIVDRGKTGSPMNIENFRPRLTQRTTGRTLLGGAGGHHADLYEQIPKNSSVRDWEHGFATPEGHPLSDEIAYLLTGPPGILKTAGKMVESGTSLDLLQQSIRDAIANTGK